jgi:hypothetical protein
MMPCEVSFVEKLPDVATAVADLTELSFQLNDEPQKMML